MHIGLLGAGRIGAFHATTLAGLARVGAITLWDPRQDVASAVAAKVGARVADSAESLLDERMDALLICSSPATHEELLTASVHKGVPTFCEQPIATTIDAAARLLELVESAEVPVTVGFQRRSDPTYEALRDRVIAGSLGTLYLARLVSSDDGPTTSGGLFVDQNVHDFDILRYVTGQEIVEVYASGAALADDVEATGGIDTAVTVLTLSGGTVASLTSSRHSAAGHDVSFELAGSKGVASVGVPNRERCADGVTETTTNDAGPLSVFADAYRAELDRFLDHVEGAAPNPCSVRDAYTAFSVALSVSASRVTGRPVPVSVGQRKLG